MYADVVLGLRPKEKTERDPFEAILERKKQSRGVRLDTQLSADDLREVVAAFKAEVKNRSGKAFPDDPHEQLWGAIGAVFGSWNNDRAIAYRELYHIPHEWGTAVNVQAMVFGNLGETCATGVAFTRNPSTGEKEFYGEFLVNAQGEDVVAGIRTPSFKKFARFLRSITKRCRTLNSPSKMASCGCCKLARASAPVLPPCALPWIWLKSASSARKRRF
jgi:pyruvate,orthophosphate dikinase